MSRLPTRLHKGAAKTCGVSFCILSGYAAKIAVAAAFADHLTVPLIMTIPCCGARPGAPCVKVSRSLSGDGPAAPRARQPATHRPRGAPVASQVAFKCLLPSAVPAVGAIAQGQRIMEVDLANQLQVSRVPVREALKILQAQGIVVSRPHYGVRVARYDEEKIVQIYEVRCNLEKIAIRDACKRRHAMPALLAKLDAIVGKMESALRRNDFIGVSKADLEFHHEICRASGQ